MDPAYFVSYMCHLIAIFALCHASPASIFSFVLVFGIVRFLALLHQLAALTVALTASSEASCLPAIIASRLGGKGTSNCSGLCLSPCTVRFLFRV